MTTKEAAVNRQKSGFHMQNRKNIKYRCFTDTQFEGIYFLCFKCDGYLKKTAPAIGNGEN